MSMTPRPSSRLLTTVKHVLGIECGRMCWKSTKNAPNQNAAKSSCLFMLICFSQSIPKRFRRAIEFRPLRLADDVCKNSCFASTFDHVCCSATVRDVVVESPALCRLPFVEHLLVPNGSSRISLSSLVLFPLCREWQDAAVLDCQPYLFAGSASHFVSAATFALDDDVDALRLIRFANARKNPRIIIPLAV